MAWDTSHTRGLCAQQQKLVKKIILKQAWVPAAECFSRWRLPAFRSTHTHLKSQKRPVVLSDPKLLVLINRRVKSFRLWWLGFGFDTPLYPLVACVSSWKSTCFFYVTIMSDTEAPVKWPQCRYKIAEAFQHSLPDSHRLWNCYLPAKNISW